MSDLTYELLSETSFNTRLKRTVQNLIELKRPNFEKVFNELRLLRNKDLKSEVTSLYI